MSASKTFRGEFQKPYPGLKGPGANEAVDALFEKVTKAKKQYGEPNEEDYEIANEPLWHLQGRLIISQDLTLKRVLEARIRLTIQASLTTHCLTAFPYEEALEEAENMELSGDDDTAQSVLDCYPLYGLVFSVKDCVHVYGLPTTLGCLSRATQEEAASAELVQKMQDMGAMLIAKTTAPQLIMSNTTHSPLWGTTHSPIQTAEGDEKQSNEFQVGGSSGGEAALVKMGGSQIGIGTDMGGSVRQPACLNELFGYKYVSKPQDFRWKLPKDFMTGLPHTSVPATAPGLLSRCMPTLELVARVIGSGEAQDFDKENKWMDEVVEDGLEELEAKEHSNPRIVYTTQKSSPEVSELIQWLVKSLKDRDMYTCPEQCDPLGDIDLAAWTTAWTEHAKEHGFDEAREMLGNDPLITRTLFDESRLSSVASDSDKKSWKPDSECLAKLEETFIKQAGITDEIVEEPENVMFITPTYILGGAVQNEAFVQLDDAGESEIWCQIFNLLDWPAISIPFAHLPSKVREELRNKAESDPKWAKHLPGKVKGDVIWSKTSDDEVDRLAHLSLQLATLPGKHASLLDYARRITEPQR